MKTYLELVNDAIRESGVDLDSLSVLDFASPTDKMHERFKHWVSQAWKELQMERNEWEFKSKRATLNINPRIEVYLGDRSVAPPVDSTFIGNDTGATFKVVGTELLDGAWSAGTAKAVLDILDINGDYRFNEYFDEISPTPANLDAFRLKGWGRYDLRQMVSDLSEADNTTFFVQDAGGSTIQPNTSSANLEKLLYVPWASWVNYYEEAYGGLGTPRYFTTTPEGKYDFWPRLDKQYTLYFTYLSKPASLADDDDTLYNFPEEYEDAIVWRAVMYYAEYDRQFDVFQRASRRYGFYKNRLERNQMPPVYFGPCKYDER